MSIKRVDPNGVIEINFPAFNGVTIVGSSSNILGDGDDATYVDGNPDALDYDVEFDALPSYGPTDPIVLHFRISFQTDVPGTLADMFLFLQDNHPTDITGDWYVGQFTSSWNSPFQAVGPFDGSIHEYAVPLVPRPSGTGSGYGVAGTTLADCLAVLASGTAYVAVNSLDVEGATLLDVRVHEMWLEVGTANRNAPPLRHFPRSDGLGSGPKRIYPPPDTRRRFGGTV